MGWEPRTKKAHTCKRPDAWQAKQKRVNTGDIWKCRRCGTRWELTGLGLPSTSHIGPIHENTWRVADDPVERPRQFGTDWLHSVQENKA